jgi:hypothetical protein
MIHHLRSAATVIVLMVAFGHSANIAHAEAPRPNIVLIVADDNNQLSWAISANCCEFL